MPRWSPCSRTCCDYVPDGAELKAKLNDTTRAQLLQAMPGLKERAKTLIELIDSADFIFADRPLAARAEGGGAADAGDPRADRPAARRRSSRSPTGRADNHGSRDARLRRSTTTSSSARSPSRCGWR